MGRFVPFAADLAELGEYLDVASLRRVDSAWSRILTGTRRPISQHGEWETITTWSAAPSPDGGLYEADYADASMRAGPSRSWSRSTTPR